MQHQTITRPQDTPKWLTQQEAAERAGVTARTIRRWIYAGKLRGYRVGGTAVRIKPDDVDAVILPIVPTGVQA